MILGCLNISSVKMILITNLESSKMQF